MHRQGGCAKASSDPEAQIEASDEHPGRKAHWSAWNLEVGKDEDRAGFRARREVGDEAVNLLLSEAVQEEMGNYEIVRRARRIRDRASRQEICEGAGVALVNMKAIACEVAAARKQAKHCGAGIHGSGSSHWIAAKQLCQEAAVTVTEHKRAPAIGETRQKVLPAALQCLPEGKMLKPSIWTGD